MKEFKTIPFLTAIIILFFLSATQVAQAVNVTPGVDLFVTPPESNTYVDLSHFPIPADFFGPGSDPFMGQIGFQGQPLNTIPPDTLGPTDAIIKRNATAILPACGSSSTIETEILALNLVSIQPITVTYNGGQNPELWDVQVCLSSVLPQPLGSMTITQGCNSGGTFTAVIPVLPKFTFIKVDNPAFQISLDFGNEGLPAIQLETPLGFWLHSDPGFNIITSPGGLTVDHDCDGTANVPVGASSNFFPGIMGTPCDCSNEPANYNIVMTYLEHELFWAGHGVIPPYVIVPVYDLWETPEEDTSFIDFGCGPGPGIPPIPADFFGPGSDPFDGIVALKGDSLQTSPPGVLGPTDTIVKRNREANLPQCPSSDQVEIEIVALSLVSAAPITVTYNGGQNPEIWDVHVCLSDSPQSTGSMTINRACQEGGTFTANIPVLPKFVFIKVDPPHDQRIYDLGLEGTPPISYDIANSYWLFSDPGFGIYTSPGNVHVDNCGNLGALIGLSAVDLIPGLQVSPCDDCVTPPSTFDIPVTSLTEPNDCARQDVVPPHPGEGPGCDYVVGDVNGSNSYNGLDITYGVNFFKGGSDPICDTCECPPHPFFWVCGDVNASCSYNGLDITYGVNYFKGGADPIYCPDCPPPDGATITIKGRDASLQIHENQSKGDKGTKPRDKNSDSVRGTKKK